MQKVKNWHFKIIKAFVVGDQVYAASGLKETTKKKKVHHHLFPRAVQF